MDTFRASLSLSSHTKLGCQLHTKLGWRQYKIGIPIASVFASSQISCNPAFWTDQQPTTNKYSTLNLVEPESVRAFLVFAEASKRPDMQLSIQSNQKNWTWLKNLTQIDSSKPTCVKLLLTYSPVLLVLSNWWETIESPKTAISFFVCWFWKTRVAQGQKGHYNLSLVHQ